MSAAQWSLGEMYTDGKAVHRDRSEAHKWLSLAVAYGEAYPGYLRRLLEIGMTKQELAEARTRFNRVFIPDLPR